MWNCNRCVSPGAIPNIITSSDMWSRFRNSEVILLPFKIEVVSWSVPGAGGGGKGEKFDKIDIL